MKFEYIDIIAIIAGIISCVIVFMLVRNIVHDNRCLKEMGPDIDNHDYNNNDYRKLQDEIYTLEKKVVAMEEKNKMFEEDIKRIMSYNIDTFDNIYSYLIAITNNIHDDKKQHTSFILSLRKDRARLAAYSIFLSKEKRLQGIGELAFLGEESDMVDLERIIHDPTEDIVIKDFAADAKIQIEKRLKEELTTKEKPI